MDREVEAVGEAVLRLTDSGGLRFSFPCGYSPHPNPVLDYSGEHNMKITTNPYGFLLLFSC